MDRADVHRAQRVNLLIDSHGTDFRGHGGPNPASDQNGHHHGRQFLADGVADDAAHIAADSTLDEQRAGLQRDDAADEKGEDTNHQQARIADLEELVKYLLALAPGQRQRHERLPEQQDHFSDILKHGQG